MPMVHIRDEGAEFEGSVETVWRFMNSGEPHAKAHTSIRNRQAKPVGEHTMMATMERNWQGQWVKVVNRITILPPLGMVTEFMEGPFAGSKTFTVYTPKEGKTRVDVYGEFQSPTLAAAELEPMAMKWLEESFNEDAPVIKAMQNTP
jgi:hypothetical protein